MDDLFRCAPIRRFPLGKSLDLVYSVLKRSAHIVSPTDAKAAALFGRFRKASEHLAQLQQVMPAAEFASLDLAALAERGLLVSGSELLSRVSTSRAEVPGQLAWFAVPTCDRPVEFDRAINSYVANFARFGRNPKILIADDSRLDEHTRVERATQLRRRVGRFGLSCWYAGRKEKYRLIELLTEDGEIPRCVAEFAICPNEDLPTMGANRNAIQLCTAGEMVLTADDDTICQPCCAPGRDEPGRLRLCSEVDATEFWFFPDHHEAVAAARAAELDIMAAHENLLGRPLWAVVRGLGSDSILDLETMCNHLLSSLWTGQGKVAVTSNGCVGDSGMYSAWGVRYHDGCGTRDRLSVSEIDYRMAIRSRQVIRQAPSTTICHGSPFSAMFVGLDNRQLLPPFLPVCRNEDGVFAFVLNRCNQESYFGYLPWALVHAPAGCREYCDGVATRISEILIACGSTWNAPNTTCAEKRLGSLGSHLVDISSMPPDEFREMIEFASWRRASARIAKAESLLNASAYCPSYWEEDVVKEIEAILATVVKPAFALPSDLFGAERLEELLARTQKIVRQYGDLLCWWPAMMEKAKELSANDQIPIERI